MITKSLTSFRKRIALFAGFSAQAIFGGLLLMPSMATAQNKVDEISFRLVPNPQFEQCLRKSAWEQPSAVAHVFRGKIKDTLELDLSGIRPGLQFDLFTVQRSSLLSNGQPDPNFKNFGLAWYQSDVQIGTEGRGHVEIKTILLDQIFGFDPDVALKPTNSFQVGFWFNNPQDAAACGFDVSKPTPFNGEHKAGPLAMITLPNPQTGLGPLCTDPDKSHPGSCNP
jgi:hypothetical protein